MAHLISPENYAIIYKNKANVHVGTFVVGISRDACMRYVRKRSDYKRILKVCRQGVDFTENHKEEFIQRKLEEMLKNVNS